MELGAQIERKRKKQNVTYMLHFAFLQNEKETRNFESLIFASMIILQRLDGG